MTRERPSLQDRIRSRQQRGFVGREVQIAQYRENLRLPADDEKRRYLFNIYGDAGVGKTYLTRQLRQIAAEEGALTAYTDEAAQDVPAAMTAIAAELRRGGVELPNFGQRAAAYLQRRHELEADPNAPDGVASFLTKTMVTIGLAAARDVPVAGSLLAPLDPATAADQANAARQYITRKIRDHADARLVLSPADELTPVFAAELNRAAARRPLALFFDTYERTALILDRWLHDLLDGRYGQLPETMVSTISGQNPLNPNLWSGYRPFIAEISLEPFSEVEARQFLASKHVTDHPTVSVILTLSGRLPVWLATLAEDPPADAANIGDPTGDAVERFLKWEDNPARRAIAVGAALPRYLNQDVLAVIAPDASATQELFGWLCGLPFVSAHAQSWTYHEVARSAMLRLRRAQAPEEWRARHTALADAHARWATEAAGGKAGSNWAIPSWIDHTCERAYHLLCANTRTNLPSALATAVEAAEHSAARARQWAGLLSDAGRDADDQDLWDWGKRLRDGIHDSNLIQYFTSLITDAQLDKAALTVALEERGAGYLSAEHYKQALADFNRAIEVSPQRTSAMTRRGSTLAQMGRYGEALADFNRAVELDPSYDLAITSRGGTYWAMGRYREALADFSRAVELDPSSAWAVINRGGTYWAMGRYGEALGDLNRAVELDPSSASALTVRGATYRAMGRYEDALADLNRAVELDPGSALAITNRGETSRTMGRYGEALADLNRAVELDPSSASALTSRGATYEVMGRHEEALADLNRAVELDPADAWAIASRGETYWAAGRHEEALADFSRATELDPSIRGSLGQYLEGPSATS